jgi:molybdate-binding protein/DNA-binding XRE family transcriptional regulator
MKPEREVRNNLRAIRKRVGMSQQDLAAAAGVTRQTIGGIEAGLYAPTAGVALRLAKAFGCRVEDLFWLEDDMPVITAACAGEPPRAGPVRVTLAEVAGRWIAFPLQGVNAFRTEMIPCDGVARHGPRTRQLQVEPLEDPERLKRTVALAGCTPVLSLWARAAERWHPGLRVSWTFANSTEALAALRRGEVHAAGVHLSDPASGEDNAPFVARLLPRKDVVLVNLGVWEEGLLVPPGNPRRLTRGADLAQPGVMLVNREAGSGSRLLLDEALRADGVAPEAVPGYDHIVRGHLEVAATVAAGKADAGVSSASVAAAYGLDFVPLREARYDLAILKEYLEQEPVRQLLGTLDHRWVRSQLAVLGGYDTSRTGEVVAEVARAA